MFHVFCEIWATFWIIVGTIGLFILSILIFRDIVMLNHNMETVRIAHGKYKYCPNCGEKYEGCQIEGVDFNKCPPDIRLWATAHGVIGEWYNVGKIR